MKIKNTLSYIANYNDPISQSLKKLNANDHKILFVINSAGQLIGSISDGDLRRWILEGNKYNEDIPVGQICNKNVKYVEQSKKTSISSSDFSRGKSVLPIVDQNLRILYLETNDSGGIWVGDYQINKTAPPFIIAEVGNNHQGDKEVAKKLVDVAHDAGVQCVKFQMRSMDTLYGTNRTASNFTEDLGSQYTLDLLRRFQLTDEDLYEVFDYSSELGLIPMCTPWDLTSLHKLETYGLMAYKVASADFTNYELLQKIAETNKPMICSTGMSSEDEIFATVEFLEKKNADYLLLHCNSTYPTPFKDVQLNYLAKLAKISDRLVGYSGHERGIHIPIAAVALGAKVIEKHITLDKNQEGADHKVSLLPNELHDMCEQISDVHTAMGSRTYERALTQGEILNRQVLSKSIFVTTDISKNQIITRNDITIRGPGRGLQPNRLHDVIGIRANRDISSGTELFETDLTEQINKKSKYNISRPIGIPVRYHDYSVLTSNINLDFVEFHFSYADLKLNPEEFLDTIQRVDFAVHCPELFEGDHLLDLSTPNDKYREKSIQNLELTIKRTLDLKSYFPLTTKPTLVVNAGGWEKNGFLNPDQKAERYQILADTLKEIDLSGINCAIQTMPPFPWHFGGQSHHNLFVDAHEAARFCSAINDVTLCLDTSHSMMACNYYGWKLDEFIQIIAPHVSYIHLADAKGVDGEGIKFGHGDINFQNIWQQLRLTIPKAPFIPEVWQGHLNNGAGFWHALDYIETLRTD